MGNGDQKYYYSLNAMQTRDKQWPDYPVDVSFFGGEGGGYATDYMVF